MLLPVTSVQLQPIDNPVLLEKQVSLSVLRLDEIHPIVSGNKIFKLHYFLENALAEQREGIITFGGAYSNHLLATAYACSHVGLRSVGIVRGEKPALLSHTLQHCFNYGMQLEFVSRVAYNQKNADDFIPQLLKKFKNYLIVPEGGYSPWGAKGASLIMDYITTDCTHICTAVGTATTLAGLLMKSATNQQVVAVPVLKGMKDLEDRLFFLNNQHYKSPQLVVKDGFHFGGYAKKNTALLQFMNDLYNTSGIPTDFVYTGKLLYAVNELVKAGFFNPRSKVVCLHTGGLQGNLSLPPGSLVY